MPIQWQLTSILDGWIHVEHAHKYMRTNTSSGKCVIGDKNTTALHNVSLYKLYRHMNVYVFCLWAERNEAKERKGKKTVTNEHEKEEEEVAAAATQ